MQKKIEQKKPPELPDAELEVLACLWQKQEASARDLRESMDPYRPMTHGAIATLLKRLESKGLVGKRKGDVGKAFLYRPKGECEPIHRKIMRDLRQRIFGGSDVAIVASLFESSTPSEEELTALEGLLDELRQKRKRHKLGGEDNA